MNSDRFAMVNLTAGELNALVKNVGGEDAVRRINRGELEVRELEKPGLLLCVAPNVIVPGGERLNAAEAFAVGNHADGVRIYSVDRNFREHFLGKTEEDVPEVTVAAYELMDDSRDPAIITALGGEEYAELTLAHVRELMRRTQAGEKSPLQSGVNVLYARDENGVMWAVNAYWGAGVRDWGVHACSVGHPDPWYHGGRVLSRSC